jgi:hypothetical protein
MAFLEPEIQRLRSLRAMQAGLVELKWLRDVLRLERAIQQHGRALKYGYNPAQPRLPKGEDGAGEWTATDANGNPISKVRSRDDRIRIAGEWPSNDPPEIPEKRPPTSRERTAILKDAARKIGEGALAIEGFFKLNAWLWTRRAEIESYRDPPRTLKELQERASAPEAGYDVHHIVERQQIDHFSKEVINGSENLVLVPRLKHQDINSWYQTKNPEFGGISPREYLDGRSWGVQRAVGLEALRKSGVLRP